MSLLDEAMDFTVKFLKNLRDRGLEYTSGRYYSKYMGFVTDADDPQGQGRVKVSCEVANGRTVAIEKWALPSADYAGQDKGLFLPPDKGDVVWVWFDHGDRSQPRYSGSFWGNTDPAKARGTSDVPAEFREGTGPPTARGFKTKAGHGWLAEDSESAGKRFELWTGAQGGAGSAATKHHHVVLNDKTGEEEVLITSFGEQKIRLIDVAGQESIEVTTKNGLFTKLLDYIQKIEAGGPLGFKLTIDERTGRIALETPAGNKVEILENGSLITIQDATGNSAKLSPAGIDITSTVAVNVNAAAAVNIAAGAAAGITAAGALSVTGAGMTIASTGGAPAVQTASGVSTNTFTGLKTETFLGGLMQVVLGLWQVTSTIVDIVAPVVDLGAPGTKFLLMDSRFVALFNAHTHPTTAPAVPTGPPVTPATIGLHTTTAAAAN
jgi:hypothetical protein